MITLKIKIKSETNAIITEDTINSINIFNTPYTSKIKSYSSEDYTINWSYVNILDTKSQTFLCCTSS